AQAVDRSRRGDARTHHVRYSAPTGDHSQRESHSRVRKRAHRRERQLRYAGPKGWPVQCSGARAVFIGAHSVTPSSTRSWKLSSGGTGHFGIGGWGQKPITDRGCRQTVMNIARLLFTHAAIALWS